MNVYCMGRGVVREGGVVHVVEDVWAVNAEERKRALCGYRVRWVLVSARYLELSPGAPVDHRPVTCGKCLEHLRSMGRRLRELTEGRV